MVFSQLLKISEKYTCKHVELRYKRKLDFIIFLTRFLYEISSDYWSGKKLIFWSKSGRKYKAYEYFMKIYNDSLNHCIFGYWKSPPDKRTFIPLPQDKPQQPQWVKLDLCQWYHWCKSSSAGRSFSGWQFWFSGVTAVKPVHLGPDLSVLHHLLSFSHSSNSTFAPASFCPPCLPAPMGLCCCTCTWGKLQPSLWHAGSLKDVTLKDGTFLDTPWRKLPKDGYFISATAMFTSTAFICTAQINGSYP